MSLAGNDAEITDDNVTGAKSDLKICLQLNASDLTVQAAAKAFETQYPTPAVPPPTSSAHHQSSASSSSASSTDPSHLRPLFAAEADVKTGSSEKSNTIYSQGGVTVEDISEEAESVSSPDTLASGPLDSKATNSATAFTPPNLSGVNMKERLAMAAEKMKHATPEELKANAKMMVLIDYLFYYSCLLLARIVV